MQPTGPLIDLRDIPAALGLLTRLPIRFATDFPQQRGAAAAWAYPLVGLVTAFLGLLVATAAMLLRLDPPIAAGLFLLSSIFVTGALHYDGLADTADGLWGGWTAERRLEIMKDSHIGTYGVLALIITGGLTWLALTQLITSPKGSLAILAAASASRAAMVLVMYFLPRARPTGLSASVGRPSAGTTLLAAILGCALLVPLGVAALVACGAGLLTTMALARLAQSRIGGQTGDILGATQQLSELSMLLVFVALLT